MTGSREVSPTGRRALANHLGTGPFDAALRAAVQERGLTLDRLRSHLARRGIRIGLSSLSDWQHGRSRPGSAKSLQAVEALEEILGLRHAALVDLLAHPGQPATNRSRTNLDESSKILSDLLAAVPVARDDLHVLASHHTAWLNEHGQIHRSHHRKIIRARRDGVDRYVLRYFGEKACDIDRVRLDDLQNCRVGRVARHADRPVMLAELLFDEALASGETWVFECSIRAPAAERCTTYAHGFAQPEDQHVLELRFHPKALPADCHVYRRESLVGPAVRTADLTLSSHNAVHLVATGVREGVLGIAWSWPADTAHATAEVNG